MIIDKLENIKYYPQLAKYEKAIYTFARKCDEEELEDGRYTLLAEDELVALVQRYKSSEKSDMRMESHKQYADLQYILKGRERIFYDIVSNLEVLEDKSKNGDIIFYKNTCDKGGICIEQGMFGYYAPQDAHRPCVQAEDGRTEHIEKIVFKIKWQE